jgi:hypothetical protein
MWAPYSETAGPSTTLHPDFLLRLVALINLVRLSLMKAACAGVSGAAWQEIRVRSGRDDNSVREEDFICHGDLSRVA